MSINKRNNRGETPLIEAAKHGKIKAVKELIAQGADINMRDSRGRTPLCHAARNGKLKTLKTLIKKGADLNILADKKAAQTILVSAISTCHEAVAMQLISEGVDINTPDADGRTALMYAAHYGMNRVEKALLEKGAIINVADQKHKTALDYAQDRGESAEFIIEEKNQRLVNAAAQGSLEKVREYLDAQADIHAKNAQGKTPLMQAVIAGHSKVVALLLECGADITDISEDTAVITAQENEKQKTLAVLRSHWLKKLQKDSPTAKKPLILSEEYQRFFDWSLRQNDYQTAIVTFEELIKAWNNVALRANNTDQNSIIAKVHQLYRKALESGDLKLIKIVDQHPLRKKIKNKHDPIFTAVQNSDLEMLKYLLSTGTDSNVLNSQGQTALFTAVQQQNHNTDIVTTLLKARTDPNIADEKGKTALMYAAEHSPKESVDLLIKYAAKVDATTPSQTTPLLIAFKNRRYDIADMLMRQGANINVLNDQGDSPLVIALKNNDQKQAEALLDKQATVDMPYDGDIALIQAARTVSRNILKKMLKNTDNIDIENSRKETALIAAVDAGNADNARLLLQTGAHINHANQDGKAALHFAIQKANIPILKMLIASGADLNQKLSNGLTPLMLAIDSNNLEIVQALLKDGVSYEHSVNINDVDSDDNTALMRAVTQSDDIFEHLLNHQPNINFTNNKGHSALSLALDAGQNTKIALLLKHNLRLPSDIAKPTFFTRLLGNRQSSMMLESSFQELKDGKAFNYTECLKNVSSGGKLKPEYLLQAVSANDEALVSFLLQLGISPNALITAQDTAPNKKHSSVFMHLMEELSQPGQHKRQKYNILQLMIEHGSQLEQKDSKGNTPWGYAFVSNNSFLKKTILEAIIAQRKAQEKNRNIIAWLLIKMAEYLFGPKQPTHEELTAERVDDRRSSDEWETDSEDSAGYYIAKDPKTLEDVQDELGLEFVVDDGGEYEVIEMDSSEIIYSNARTQQNTDLHSRPGQSS